ncbi:MAG: hypothetical protein ACRC2T_11470 [Thermoguttaceae bacterium]
MWIKKWAAEQIREEYGISGCRSLLRLDKEVRRAGELLSYETHYWVSSLDPDAVSASEFQGYIQGHWEVENCLHMQKDRDWDEDKHVLRGDNLGEVWTVLTSIAVSISRLLFGGERCLREVCEKNLADPRRTAKRLGFKK